MQAMSGLGRCLAGLAAVLVLGCSTPSADPQAGTADAAAQTADIQLNMKVDVVKADSALPDVTDATPSDDAEIQEDTGPEAEADIAKKSGFNYECKPMTMESCVTACGSAGMRGCLKEWGPCLPPPEFCGNCADDDCNGLVNDGCPPNPICFPPPVLECPVALVAVAEGKNVAPATLLHLSAAGSFGQGAAKIAKWAWSVQAPPGAAGTFLPGANVPAPTYFVDVAGQYLFHLEVWDDQNVPSCVQALASVAVASAPPTKVEAGCADGTREGFADQGVYGQIAACSGAWDHPGITPDAVVPTCAKQGGNSGAKASGVGCAAPDLCAVGWHICKGWQEVAAKSPTGCAGATPIDAKPKSLFFAIRQPSEDGSKCGKWGDGFNDVFGCGNLGTTLAPEKTCGPLDRVLASTKPNSCGFNEAEPTLGPWECLGPGKSDLNEGANLTKKACQGGSCQYDGAAVGASDKGGVLCCQDGP